MPDQGIRNALALAEAVHAGQLDKGGTPYIEHVKAVGQMAAAAAPAHLKRDAEIVGILHDTLEDFRGDKGNLRREISRRFGLRILHAVEAMTKRPGETYTAYLDRVIDNEIARIVKLGDARHNLDHTRLGHGVAVHPNAARYELVIARLS